MKIDFSELKKNIENAANGNKQIGFGITREVLQRLMLCSLSETDFFEASAFCGGTSLRIIHGLERFSEDMDFSSLKPNNGFSWQPYLEKIQKDFAKSGLDVEFSDKSKPDSTVKKAFVKDSSLGQALKLGWQQGGATPEKIKIKFEIDTNPPEHSKTELKEISGTNSKVRIHTLPSLFAGKSHALLTREYVKGRDWYDFDWYATKGIEPNYKALESALKQTNPEKYPENKFVDRNWYINSISEKINSIDWDVAKRDVFLFVISPKEKERVEQWSKDYFQTKVSKLEQKYAQKEIARRQSRDSSMER